MPYKQFALNTVGTFLSMVIQFSVNFFLTSYLVNTIGSTAYGFFTLANTVVNYALIISTALNSMSARFVGYDYHNGNIRSAIKYFSSVFWGDIVFVLVLLVVASPFLFDIENFINIPSELVSDVRLLFFIVFANMLVNVAFSVFSGVYIIKNRLDISAIMNIIGNVVKAGLLVLLYCWFDASIVYLGIATLIATLVVIGGNVYYTKHYMPEIKPSVKYVQWGAIVTIITAGMWNSFSQLSIMLLHGFDLLMSNLMVNAAAMGFLAVAGTMPNALSTCISSMSNLFAPKFLEDYSKSNYHNLCREVQNSIKFMTVISCMPLAFLIGFGESFYRLWTPNTDFHTVYILSVLVIIPNITGSAIMSTNYLYTVANKVKLPSIVLFINGCVNLLLVYCLLKSTSLGVYAIVIVSALLGFLRNVVFNAPYAAKCINQPFYIFYRQILKSIVSIVVCSLLCYSVNIVVDINSWLKLFAVGIPTVLCGGTLVTSFILDKKQRKGLIGKIVKL